jgi:tetratricopeptide (TPR) repeat protein
MDHHNTTTTNNKLLDTLHSIAGKPLLDDASFPNNKPLRAALSVLQGRVAEALLLSITTTTTTDSTLLLSLDPSALQSVMKRCRDVHDTRLECFLQLLLLLLPEPHNNNNNHKKKKKKKLLRSLAEGCYYRATEATPDAPPLWKKLVDLHYLEYTDTTTSSSSSNSNSNSNWRVVVPLEQLQRIARSKQNHKRVQEVAVTLAECVLEQEAGVVGSSSSDDDDDDDWTKTFLKVFVVPYRPVQPYDPIVATSKAREYLQTVGEDEDDNKEDNNSTIQPLRLALVWLRMELMEEDARLQQLAEEEYLKAKNRSSISVNVTKKDCFRETRAKYLAESMVASIQTSSNNNNDDDKYVPTSMHVRALTLRDLLLNRNKEPSETDDSGRWQQACAVLTLYLQRQQDSIQAAANVKANKPKTLSSLSSNNPNIMRQLWMQLRDFVWPLLKTLETRTTEQDDNRSVWTIDSLSSEQLALTQQVIYTIIFSEWMLSADVMMKEYHTTSGYCTLDQLRLCRDVLKILMEREKEASKQQQQVNVIGGTATQYDVSLQSAYRSATAWVYLYSQASSDRNAQQSRIVSQAVSQTETVSEMHGSIFEYGAAYLEFLVGWSGLHKEPWSFCITPEARTLVAKARVCLEKAGQQWGRPVSWLERVMLDVGWADAHVGSMSLLDEASALYRKSIEVITAKLDNHEDADVHAVILARLLQCKCVYGECLLQLFGDDGAEDLQRLESDLKLSLGVLQDMDTDATTGSLLSFWRDQGATLSAIRFLLASGRQLVADALLRRGLSAHQQARDFLEQGVRDSPADPTALFSFGAFHLRMALFGKEEVSEDWTKLAQALLLRAAKADATKASPFALLGCWYERAGDMARAVGCYSKAIALDASHPVAGRGLLRLRPADALLQVLEKATSETSSRSGWAWRSLGEAKAEVNGDDDLAIVSLVTALRCRDIVCPQSDSLSCFYVDPRQNCESMRNEFVTVSAELAACYRRVGRYTASIRCYESAIEAAGEAVSSSLLCSCAQGMCDSRLRIHERFTFTFVSYSNFPLRLSGTGTWFTRRGIGKVSVVTARQREQLPHHSGIWSRTLASVNGKERYTRWKSWCGYSIASTRYRQLCRSR